MSKIKLVIQSFIFYWRKNLAVALGVAVSTAILTGALVVGDSMQYSLQRLVDLRLGNVTHTLTAGDRYFSEDLALQLENRLGKSSAAVLVMEGSAVVGGGEKRLPKVQILGLDEKADKVFGLSNHFSELSDDEVIISENLATRLDVEPGETILFRIRKASLIPLNAPFVSDEEVSVPLRLTVSSIAKPSEMSRFNLHNTQTAPFNAFVSKNRIDQLMELDQKVNTILIAGDDLKTSELEAALQESWSLEDLGLRIRPVQSGEQMELISVRVFLDEVISNSVLNVQPDAQPVLTYFVNSINSNSGSTPYSFVTAIKDENLSDNDIWINTWLAEDLNLKQGDSLRLNFFQVGPLRKLEVREETFLVKGIQAIEGIFGDETLAPDLPGLSDAGNCRDWETGVPIDLEAIRDKDEDYWDNYHGTPKAFISLAKGEQLWENRFGTLTAIRFEQNQFNESDFLKNLHEDFQIEDLGFVLKDARSLGKAAAANGINFGELFLGLSFFVLLSGVILSLLLFKLTIQSRIEHIGLMRSIGLSRQTIQKVLLGESSLMVLSGAMLGLALTLAYNKLLFAGLNGVWQDIIRTDIIFLRLDPMTLITGLGISIVISFLGLFLAIRKLLKRELVSLRKSISEKKVHWSSRIEKPAFIISGLVGIVLPIMQLIQQEAINPGIFFMAGGLLILSFCLGADLYFRGVANKSIKRVSIGSLAAKNSTRNRSLSLSIVLLLALGTFLIVTVGANRKNHFVADHGPTSGTGGFSLYAETTVPILNDLNDPQVRNLFNLDATTQFVQLRLNEGDDASCLNLNAISQPRILGVKSEQLSDRFSFAAKTEWLDENDPWSSLDQEFDGNLIPAIADQTVIQWSLLKAVGDTLWYTGHDGEEFGIILIGGLVSSVFQGNLLISDKAFLEKFPNSSGSSVLLVAGNRDGEELAAEINSALRDFGIDIQSTPARLAEFSSVENTYLSIFLLLGALGLLIGTLGLGIVLARSVQERQQEIALQRAIGIPKNKIFLGILLEFSGLMIPGILIGSISALIAVLPGLISPGTEVQVLPLIGLIAAIILNGLIWISLFASFSLRKENLAIVLKNE